ncbi:MAG: glycosyl transferase [Ignavibacteriales bacterium]|nr:glycosyl transferase [Ignavibacteriales bacterium]
MLHFCTLFDKNYISRGIALYESLEKVSDRFHLYVFAFDNETADVLTKLEWKHASIIPLEDFETDQLLSVKSSRTPAEYCWTSTPATIIYVLEHFNVDHCTYIDADLYFYHDPAPLFEELGQSSVLITEHRYSKEYDKSAKSGIYCVQYNTFRNTPEGFSALRWWNDRCIEWCYNREEDGKFGDQKYLDDWTTRFNGVRVLQNLGGAIAPWNVQQYSFQNTNSQLLCRHKTSAVEIPVIFYHFHYLRFYEHTTIELGDYYLSDEVRERLYYPYIRHLQEIKKRIVAITPSLDIHGNRPFERGLKQIYITAKRKLYRRYNRYEINGFLRSLQAHE